MQHVRQRSASPSVMPGNVWKNPRKSSTGSFNTTATTMPNNEWNSGTASCQASGGCCLTKMRYLLKPTKLRCWKNPCPLKRRVVLTTRGTTTPICYDCMSLKKEMVFYTVRLFYFAHRSFFLSTITRCSSCQLHQINQCSVVAVQCGC